MSVIVRALDKHFNNIFLVMQVQMQLKILKLILGVTPKTNKFLLNQ